MEEVSCRLKMCFLNIRHADTNESFTNVCVCVCAEVQQSFEYHQALSKQMQNGPPANNSKITAVTQRRKHMVQLAFLQCLLRGSLSVHPNIPQMHIDAQRLHLYYCICMCSTIPVHTCTQVHSHRTQKPFNILRLNIFTVWGRSGTKIPNILSLEISKCVIPQYQCCDILSISC